MSETKLALACVLAMSCGGHADRPPDWSAVTVDRVAACAAFPTPLVAGPCTFEKGDAPRAERCTLFAPASAAGLWLFAVALYRGPSQFAKATGLDAVTPAEPSRTVDIAPDRTVTKDTRGMFIGGGVEWGTLPSKDGTFQLVFSVEQVAHDYPVTHEQLEALHAIDTATVLKCLDGALWP